MRFSYCTPQAVLNISRESMARYEFSPATRVFEAAGAGACIISDRGKGIELFLEPDKEEVAEILRQLTPQTAKEIGTAARQRVLAYHTYAHHAKELESVLSRVSS